MNIGEKARSGPRRKRPARPGTASGEKKPKSLFGRLFPVRFVVFGVAAGLIFSVFIGVYIIYADMMSRVTYAGDEIDYDDFYDSFYDIPDLMNPDNADEWELDMMTWLQQENGDRDGNGIPDDLSEMEGLAPAQTGTIGMKRMDGVENILLFGVDTHSYRGRSDVTMIISINHNTRKVNIVSLMRAMYVRIGARNHNWGLLNAAYSYGGPGLAIRMVESNFGIPIKGFVAVNFNSFVRIINALGGVTINLTPAEARYLGLRSGTNRLSGNQALAYSRIRKLDSDFQRNQRQRNVINSILNEMAASGGSTAYKVATVVLANTYTNLDLNQYVSKAPTYLTYQRQQLQLPAMNETRKFYVQGQEVWWFDMVRTQDRLVNFLMR